MSSELIFSLLPIFMVTTLGASMTMVGLIEGIAESTTLIAKIFSGALSDILGKRKLMATIGYGISALSKPLFPLANSITMVFFARFFDRFGKGIRDAPRDALIGEIAPKDIRGTCFGLRQSLDTVGAVMGPLLGILLMYLLVDNIPLVFWIAVIPGFISLGILIFFVEEPKKKTEKIESVSVELHEIKLLGWGYWKVSTIGFLLTLARFSQAFLIVKAQASGLQLMWIPIIVVVMNVFYAFAGYPAGILSDTINRKFVLLIGILFLIVGDVILGFSSNLWFVFLGVILWGLHMGFTEGLLAAMVTDTTRSHFRGTAYGIYNFINGIGMLIASLLAGILWDKYGSIWTFLSGGSFSVVAFILIIIFFDNKIKK
ncbi:MAG: MFS transporter [Verrucomicrobia bacterium]|nr:MAG: MFS transporter [Verrucomicrobiota bacterium]